MFLAKWSEQYHLITPNRKAGCRLTLPSPGFTRCVCKPAFGNLHGVPCRQRKNRRPVRVSGGQDPETHCAIDDHRESLACGNASEAARPGGDDLLAEEASVPGGPNIIRHTVRTWLAEGGVPDAEADVFMGHKPEGSATGK